MKSKLASFAGFVAALLVIFGMGGACIFTNACYFGGNEEWTKSDAKKFLGNTYTVVDIKDNETEPGVHRMWFDLVDNKGKATTLVVADQHKFLSVYEQLRPKDKVTFAFSEQNLDVDEMYHRHLEANYLIPSVSQ